MAIRAPKPFEKRDRRSRQPVSEAAGFFAFGSSRYAGGTASVVDDLLRA
jgi:hypothetical protein